MLKLISQLFYYEIMVQLPPTLEVFASYKFQPNNDPQSFADAMKRPDRKSWWEAFCTEIHVIISNNTYTLTDLLPEFKALPLP